MQHLLEELELHFGPPPLCLALTGSGGKTTAMIRLARHYAEKGMRVLVSTTTKLALPQNQEYGCNTYFLDDRALSYHPSQGERVLYAHVAHKAVAPPLGNLMALLDRYDVVLLEADGSMNLGLKLHQERDPVVPPFVTGTLALVAMNLIGKPFLENCFGAEHYRNQFPEEFVSLATYSKLLEHPEGILKRVQGKSLVLCNQGREEDIDQYKILSSSVSHTPPIWFGDLLTDQLIHRNPS
ncbi:MAG: putative selenium-dependent hydroxylase accessory protein YqeC [Spirochaetia bacterium]|nr:putative selenium-dependent hydroxylase accessory protein YqeC [Spirochaetia bacterium]